MGVGILVCLLNNEKSKNRKERKKTIPTLLVLANPHSHTLPQSTATCIKRTSRGPVGEPRKVRAATYVCGLDCGIMAGENRVKKDVVVLAQSSRGRRVAKENTVTVVTCRTRVTLKIDGCGRSERAFPRRNRLGRWDRR